MLHSNDPKHVKFHAARSSLLDASCLLSEIGYFEFVDRLVEMNKQLLEKGCPVKHEEG